MIRILIALSFIALMVQASAFAGQNEPPKPADLPHSDWRYDEIRDSDQMTETVKFVWDNRFKRIFVVSVRLDGDELAGDPDGYTWEELVDIFKFDWMEANDPSFYCESPLPKWMQWLQQHCVLVPQFNSRTIWQRRPDKTVPEVVIYAPVPEARQRWQIDFVNTLNFLYELKKHRVTE